MASKNPTAAPKNQGRSRRHNRQKNKNFPGVMAADARTHGGTPDPVTSPATQVGPRSDVGLHAENARLIAENTRLTVQLQALSAAFDALLEVLRGERPDPAGGVLRFPTPYMPMPTPLPYGDPTTWPAQQPTVTIATSDTIHLPAINTIPMRDADGHVRW